MNNKKSGNQFEDELCQILSEHGYWTHNFAQNSAGQPADVIAVKDGCAYLIDCKVCSNGYFSIRRIEENQALAMQLWRDCGNGVGWFAMKFGDTIYMVSMETLEALKKLRTTMPEEIIAFHNLTLENWLRIRA